MTLSVCLIVKNEEQVLRRCLSCAAKFADEIIVADTGSNDGTVEIAKEFTDKVYCFSWCDDFSAARNFAFEKANCDLVMWLDADDVITDENCEKIVRLKENFENYDMAVLPYAAAFDNGEPTFVYDRERIFRRSGNYRFSGAVHEAVTPRGRILRSDAVIYHKKIKPSEPLRNLRILQKQIAEGKPLDDRQKFYYGRELFFNGMLRESCAVLEDFLNGNGWSVNKVEACLNLYSAYSSLGDEKNALVSLLRSFTFAPPQSQACCILGGYFFNKGDLATAIYWYRQALYAPSEEENGGFVNKDYCGFIPNMQLCVIYDRLGDIERANSYNTAAGKIKPHNENYLYNKKYFESKLGLRGNIDD
ncbi:MAG: glycosyltransferase family 2 protein [Clostridia bacterium]|nr:glycosyltransferase family 2 protein [Clostridia bacterium]